MRYDHATLSAFWTVAAEPVPLVLVGGGRWARVWADVVTRARGSSEGLAMVARRDPDDLRRWLSSRELLREVRVATSVDEACNEVSAKCAIIASRPRDHVADGLAAIAFGAHILVEKPLADDANVAGRLITAARTSQRVLAIGTEFAFLPVLHQCAASLSTRCRDGMSITLAWDDPEGEIRYGARKQRHDEVGILEDLLPHALSIFRIFSLDGQFSLGDVWRHETLPSGRLEMLDGLGIRFDLIACGHAPARRRLLTIEAGRTLASIDFASAVPIISIDGNVHAVAPDLATFDSTLRLELGAFLAEQLGSVAATAITQDIDEHVSLAKALQLAGPKRGVFVQ